MHIAELAHQAVPHLAWVASAPSRQRDHKHHQAQRCAQPHSPHFGAPRLAVLHTPLDHLPGVHFTEHGHAHLFTHLVIDLHLASSVHRKLLVVVLSGSIPDWSFLVLTFPLLAVSERYCPQGVPCCTLANVLCCCLWRAASLQAASPSFTPLCHCENRISPAWLESPDPSQFTLPSSFLSQWTLSICVTHHGSPELLMKDELIELATREEERIH